MLSGFRKLSQNWIVKILLGILLVSFGAWGIGDFLGGGATSQPALVVGNEKIDGPTVLTEFRHDLDQLSAQMGGQKLSEQQAIQYGLMGQTIQRLVTNSLLTQELTELGMVVDTDTLRQSIADIPAFQNSLHQFDKNAYAQALQGANLSEQQFLDLQRGQILRGYLVNALTGGLSAPQAMVDPLFNYRQELRVAETLAIPSNTMPAPPHADDDILRAYYKDHGTSFASPELRAVTALIIKSTDVAATIKPTDDDIQKSYQARQSEFTTPETRTIAQILFDDQAHAQQAVDSARAGKSFAVIAQEGGKTPIDLGTVDRTGMPLPALADAAFAGRQPGIVGPVQSPLGWHVLFVSRILPGTVQPLADVKDKVAADLVASKTQDAMTDLANKVDDALGAGASLEEAAGKAGLKPVKFAAIDQSGKDADGNPVDGLPAGQAFLADTFQTQSGSSSDLDELDTGDGYFVVRVDKVTPAAQQPFEAVTDKVQAAWAAAQQDDAAKRVAEADADRLRKGEDLAAVAGTNPSATTEAFPRTGSQTVQPLLASAMFSAKAGEVKVIPLPGGVIVARLKTILPADSGKQPGLYQQVGEQISQTLTGDIANQYVSGLQTEFGVKINQQAIAAQLQTNPGQ